MKTKALVILALVLPAVVGCNNFFHDLLPSDDDRIKSFSVPGQVSVEIGDNAITSYVSPGTNIFALVPAIRVDSGATVFPVTYEYTSRAFGDERTFGAAMELYTGGNNTNKVKDMIRSNRDNFTVPVIDLPINFGYPVDFLVVSARGTTRQYTVRVEVDTGEGKFKSFKFDKFFNPEMVSSAAGVVDTTAKTVTVNVSYPVENIASYQLTPVFETNGARVYLDDGKELKSGVTLVDFLKPPDSADLSNPDYAGQTKTLTLKRAGYDDSVWELTVNFSEDPDTSRAITDFRFTKALNPLISADYMAEIAHNGNTGTINVTVYYNGAKPEELRASFISPGTATVSGDMQISGYSMQDFFAPVQYVVTSRSGGYVRTYTVTVNLVPASDPLPQITYFGFSTSLNPLLVSNSTAMIDHNNRFILIEAAYDDTPPVDLIPAFSATGTVTANGVTQTSGSSSVNFSGPVGYTVSNPSNPTLKREYRVEVQFVRALSSAAEITTFTFYMADNPGLIMDTEAGVNQATGAITATLLFETPGGDRTLVPRWSAQGRVESDGIPQTSGEVERQFYTPLPLRAISADGILQKDYMVTVKEVNNRIYVKHDAAGRNDGTNWENAYRSLGYNATDNATGDVNLFPSSIAVDKEIWIAEGTYTVIGREGTYEGNTYRHGLFLYSQASFIGGFRGNEASVSERVDPANHRATITGDQGGGEYLTSIFTSIYSFRPSLSGVISFEYLVITCADTVIYWGTAGIDISGGSSANSRNTAIFKSVEFRDLKARNSAGAIMISNYDDVIITDCSFYNTQAGDQGGAIYIMIYDSSIAGNITISNCIFTNSRSNRDGGAILINGNGSASATVTNCTFVNTSSGNNSGNAIYFYQCSNRTQTGNTFTGVPSPTVTIAN